MSLPLILLIDVGILVLSIIVWTGVSTVREEFYLKSDHNDSEMKSFDRRTKIYFSFLVLISVCLATFIDYLLW